MLNFGEHVNRIVCGGVLDLGFWKVKKIRVCVCVLNMCVSVCV